MKLNLTEVVNLKVSMTRLLSNLQSERQGLLYETLEQAPESVETNPRIVKLTEEIQEVIMNLARVESILGHENNAIHAGYDSTILESISYIKRMRGELSQYQSMAMAQKKTFTNSRWDGGTGYKVAKFAPEYWKSLAIETEKNINRLSRELDKRNFTTEVIVPFADKYM